MSTSKTGNRYEEGFKRTLVNLYQSNGKSQAALCKEYGVSATALARWIKQYSTVETDDGEVLTAKQVKDFKNATSNLTILVSVSRKFFSNNRVYLLNYSSIIFFPLALPPLKLQAICIKKKIFHTHNYKSFIISPRLFRSVYYNNLLKRIRNVS